MLHLQFTSLKAVSDTFTPALYGTLPHFHNYTVLLLQIPLLLFTLIHWISISSDKEEKRMDITLGLSLPSCLPSLPHPPPPHLLSETEAFGESQSLYAGSTHFVIGLHSISGSNLLKHCMCTILFSWVRSCFITIISLPVRLFTLHVFPINFNRRESKGFNS